MNFQSIIENFADLKAVAEQLSDKDYAQPVPNLGGATIGQHMRHIIELYECLLKGYNSGTVNYDDRPRDLSIEEHVEQAVKHLDILIGSVQEEDKLLVLKHTISGEVTMLQSSYFRELLYNLEHSIHHQALIRVALYSFPFVKYNSRFGVAPATIEYRKKCAQ
ncbi:hypothetical protein SAMN05444274_102206 [Mariniphaga anaerophila]|uniref:DinB family protein n=1 Tax=Mariniphaga anaerophila TaxID=1484053 RepID=A0A1M4VTQ1_9BACT|nr:DinB family protein [Mariniphaga anaerophila]SHE72359.1 hypothetical protein SAMN05444274_102206 [Mariniphaga anaerophila]